MNLLEKNVGGIDKVLRIGAGVIMAYFGFIDTSFITDELGATLLGGFGIMFTLSGLLGMCPLYNVIGINTCKENTCKENN